MNTEDGVSNSTLGYQKGFLEEVLFELGLGGLRDRKRREGSLERRKGIPVGEEAQVRGKARSQSPGGQSCWGAMIYLSSQVPESRSIFSFLHASIPGHQNLWAENLPHLEGQEHPSGLCPSLPIGPSHTHIPQELGKNLVCLQRAVIGAYELPSTLHSRSPRTPPLMPSSVRSTGPGTSQGLIMIFLGWMNTGMLALLPHFPSKITMDCFFILRTLSGGAIWNISISAPPLFITSSLTHAPGY